VGRSLNKESVLIGKLLSIIIIALLVVKMDIRFVLRARNSPHSYAKNVTRDTLVGQRDKKNL